jgi:hypothetical protein
MLSSEFSKGESYVSTPQSDPTPLFGAMREAEPVPWEGLGPLAHAIEGISTLTQAPAAIATRQADLDGQCHCCTATSLIQPVISLRLRHHGSNRRAFGSFPPPKKAAFYQTNDGA